MQLPFSTNVFDYFSTKKEHGLKTLYAALIVLSLHASLVVFINSSYLEQYFSSESISMLYVLSSVISLISFLYAGPLLRTFGNFKLIVLLSLFEVAAVFGMAFAGGPAGAALFFVAHMVLVPFIFLSMDVFMEAIIGDQEKQTGSARGLFLVVFSIAHAIAPALSGLIIGPHAGASFSPV